MIRNIVLLLLLVLLVVFPSTAYRGANAVVEYRPYQRSCHKECTLIGNCNIEEGRCECPVGFAGPSCRTRLLSACQATKDSDPFTGFFLPKACACLEQLMSYYKCDEAACTNKQYIFASRLSRCYKFKNGSDFENSPLPSKSDPEVEWFSRRGLKKGLFKQISAEEAYKGVNLFNRRINILPFSECPDSCNFRGSCVATDEAKNARCLCMEGYSGLSCEANDASFCINNCSNRGTCHRGFCHCSPPSFGVDCSRSKAFKPVPVPAIGASKGREENEGQEEETEAEKARRGSDEETEVSEVEKDGEEESEEEKTTENNFAQVKLDEASEGVEGDDDAESDLDGEKADLDEGASIPIPPRNRLKIYIYELPTHVSFHVPAEDASRDRPDIYLASEMFKAQLLRDWSVRTENPHDANLFYVPANLYAAASNTPNAALLYQLRSVVDYIRTTFPFFNRTGGSDHFVWMPGDRGACAISPTEPAISNLIKVVHFGLHIDATQEDTSGVVLGKLPPNKDGCLNPLKDVVAAAHFNPAVSAVRITHGRIERTKGHVERPRLLFFAGSTRANQKTYSGGVRQAVTELIRSRYANDSRILFANGSVKDSYIDNYLNSDFCLAPYGSGFGIRLFMAVAYGCIPVIIQDHVLQPYSEFLPYHEFSVRLRKREIPQLISHLESYSKEDLAAMRIRLTEFHRAFLWTPELKGEAFNYTIRSLANRVNNYWGNVDRRRRRHARRLD